MADTIWSMMCMTGMYVDSIEKDEGRLLKYFDNYFTVPVQEFQSNNNCSKAAYVVELHIIPYFLDQSLVKATKHSLLTV